MHKRYPEVDGRIRFAKVGPRCVASHLLTASCATQHCGLRAPIQQKLPMQTPVALLVQHPTRVWQGATSVRGVAQVDCVQEQAMCQEHQVAGYPSIRVFRAGHDEINM